MNVWFTRSNGDTGHNKPDLARYVQGEPPTYPETTFNYRDVCISQGFARIGWPATSDLRQPAWAKKGGHQYSEDEFKDVHRSYLERFSSIQTGDLVVIPGDRDEHDVHLGRVVLRDRATRRVLTLRCGLPAYYYHFDIERGDWFENAHRVDVVWDCDADGVPAIYNVPGIGGNWFRAFGAIGEAKTAIASIAQGVGLLDAAESARG